MPHIHTQPGQHDHTASAFIIRTDGPEPCLLLHLHKKLKTYLQFGGHIELHETPWQALAHEVVEESGYTLDQLQILQPKHVLHSLTAVKLHPYPLGHMTHAFSDTHNHTDIEYAFITSSPPSKSISKGESKEIKAFTRSELQEIPPNDIPENVRELGMFIFDVCLSEWESVDANQFVA